MRQLQQLDAFLDVAPVCSLVGSNIAHDSTLLGAELGGLSVEEVVVDPAVQLVHVHGVDAVLKPAMIPMQFSHGFLMELLLVPVALAQGRSDMAQNLFREREAVEDLGKLLFEDFLPGVGFRAFPFVAGAVIVDVAPLLDRESSVLDPVAA